MKAPELDQRFDAGEDISERAVARPCDALTDAEDDHHPAPVPGQNWPWAAVTDLRLCLLRAHRGILDLTGELAEEGVMTQQVLEPHRSRIPQFFRPPSTRLGWAATAGSVGAILVVIAVNLFAVEGSGPPEGNPWWWQLFAASALVCMAASGVAGLIALVRKHERSWMVIVPSALVLLVTVSEMIQGLAYFLG